MIPGLMGAAARLRQGMGQRPCDRCGLLYNPKKKDLCPHCGDLNEQELTRFLERRGKTQQANQQLGFWLAGGAVIIVLLLILGNAL